MTSYQEFLARKALTPILAGYNDDPAPHPAMFPHQIDAFRFMARVGRGAAFLETGLGRHCWHCIERIVSDREGRPVLIFAPSRLPSSSSARGKFGVPCCYVRNRDELKPGVNATNYDRLDVPHPMIFQASCSTRAASSRR